MLRTSARCVRKIVARDPVLPWLESRLPACGEVDLATRPPVMVLGAPRSGTTLLYETLVVGLGLTCLPNLSDVFYRSPALAAWLANRWPHAFRGDSRYGRLATINGASEGGAWRQWAFGPVDEPRDLTDRDRDRIRTTLRRLTRFSGKPLCLKDTFDALRLDDWRRIAPHTVLIHTRRDPFYLAQSLLVGRRKLLRDEQRWFGLHPPETPEIKDASPVEQVAWQAAKLDEFITEQIEAAGFPSAMRVEYEELCLNPRGVVARIAEHARDRGAELPPTNLEAVPDELPAANQKNLKTWEFRDLRGAVERAMADSRSVADPVAV